MAEKVLEYVPKGTGVGKAAVLGSLVGALLGAGLMRRFFTQPTPPPLVPVTGQVETPAATVARLLTQAGQQLSRAVLTAEQGKIGDAHLALMTGWGWLGQARNAAGTDASLTDQIDTMARRFEDGRERVVDQLYPQRAVRVRRFVQEGLENLEKSRNYLSQGSIIGALTWLGASWEKYGAATAHAGRDAGLLQEAAALFYAGNNMRDAILRVAPSNIRQALAN